MTAKDSCVQVVKKVGLDPGGSDHQSDLVQSHLHDNCQTYDGLIRSILQTTDQF